MHDRGWRTARGLAAALAVLALLQLAVSVAVVGRLSPGMLAAEVALVVVLAALAVLAHVRYRAHQGYRN
jgi:hypothetical protein